MNNRVEYSLSELEMESSIEIWMMIQSSLYGNIQGIEYHYNLTNYNKFKQPGGNTPKFLAHILLKFVAVGGEKYDDEDDGFGGFKVRVEVIKSRVSAALKSVNLIYNKNSGVDMVRSTVDFAKDAGLIGGNRNGYYFLTDKDQKFTLRNMPEDFRNNPQLYKIMKDNIVPILEKNLSGLTPEEMIVPDE